MTKKYSVDQEKTTLRVKLDDFSAILKKLARSFLNLESENQIVLLESQMVNKLLSLGTNLQSLESVDGKDGEAFVSFLKSMTDIVQDIGILPQWKKKRHNIDVFAGILSLMRNLEDHIKEFLKILIIIDEKRKESDYEPFGGLIQKLIDAIEEKRHLILNSVERNSLDQNV